MPRRFAVTAMERKKNGKLFMFGLYKTNEQAVRELMREKSTIRSRRYKHFRINLAGREED